MDSSDYIDSTKAEKMNAIARYNRFTNITKFLQILEVFVAIAFISWTSTRIPIIFKITCEYLFAFSTYLMNQHVVFLVGNLIVALCYVLSRHSETASVNSGSNSDDLTAQVMLPLPFPETETPVKSTAGVVAEVTAIKRAAKQIERFKRTQSEKLKTEITVKNRRELRRSVTDKRRSMTLKSGEVTSANAVERLSNDEFRIAVEAFISRQQSLIKQQSSVDKVECVI